MVAVMVALLARVKMKLPWPPLVCLVTTTWPLALLVKAQVKVAPGPTSALQLVEPTGAKSALGLSLTVYVPGASAEKVAVPTPVLVVTVAVMVTPLERVKMKVPSPPVVFLVTTTEPLALFTNVQLKLVPGTTIAVQLVDPTGTKSGLAASVTVYVPGARPVKAVPPDAKAVPPLVETLAVAVTDSGPPVSV